MTYIVAEIGLNHNAIPDRAKELIDHAVEAGADAVKFQTFSKGRFPEIEHLRFPKKFEKQIFWYAENAGIEWFSTPFDIESIDYLITRGMKKWKVPSGMITNVEFLKRIAMCPGKKILSTGMSNLHEVNTAIGYLGKADLTVLQCTSLYPTPFEEVNLGGMFELREKFGLPVGLSDHTAGIETAIAAVAMGAEMIEKHVTLSRDMDGPDHKASIEPKELKEMVRSIRNVEKAIGEFKKFCTPGEMDVREAIRNRMAI